MENKKHDVSFYEWLIATLPLGKLNVAEWLAQNPAMHGFSTLDDFRAAKVHLLLKYQHDMDKLTLLNDTFETLEEQFALYEKAMESGNYKRVPPFVVTAFTRQHASTKINPV